MTAAAGALVLVPNALDFGTEPLVPLDDVLPAGVIRRAAAIDHWVAEDAKSARAFLKRVSAVVPLARTLQTIAIHELPRPRKGAPAGQPVDLRPLLAPALAGHDVGLLSEAGLPAVADPGADLVAAAHAAGIRVEPLPGPSSLMLALAASGLNGQSFAFVGYLPVEAAARSARIHELDVVSRRQKQTQIAIETPYRNPSLLKALIEHLAPTTRLSVACGVTLPSVHCQSRSVQAWRSASADIDDRRPAVFAWLAA